MKITITYLGITMVAALISSFWLADAVTIAHMEMSRKADKISPGMQVLADRADLLCTVLIAWVPLSGVVLGLVFKAHKAKCNPLSE